MAHGRTPYHKNETHPKDRRETQQRNLLFIYHGPEECCRTVQSSPDRFDEINGYINMLANALSMKTKVDKDNLWTKSLAMQVCNKVKAHT